MLIEEYEQLSRAAHDAVHHCPVWCVDGEDGGVEGSAMHYGPATAVTIPHPHVVGYTDATVRAEYFDLPPDHVVNVNDHDYYPIVGVHLPELGDLRLSPEHARALCAAITGVVEQIEAQPIQRRTWTP